MRLWAQVIQRVASNDEVRALSFNEAEKIFLRRPEVVEVVSQIYASRLAPDHNDVHIANLERELEQLIKLYRVCPDDQARSFAKPLFRMLWLSCDEALSAAIEHGLLAAHEAQDVARHKLLLDRLSNIDKALAVISKTTENSLDEYLSFEEKYRSQVADRHRLIAPPQYDANKRVPLERIFVPQSFHSAEAVTDSLRWDGEKLSSLFNRFVVLGQPGGGKSTFLQKLCYDLASNSANVPHNRRGLTPVLVVLREYGAQKQGKPLSILDFVEERSRSIYQVAPPKGAFDYLLTAGRTIVLFDGLDELLDTSFRQEITADVETFCNLYPSVPAVVTSRERGYEQAPLSDDRFATFKLAELQPEHMEEYVTKLFFLEEFAIESEVQARVREFFVDAAPARELLSNPLMLGLIVNLYRGHGFIPRNRPEVFQKCSEMLFSKWDTKRRILVPLPFHEHLQPAIAHLAHWIYTEPRNQQGVTGKQLVDAMVSYIHPRLYEDVEKATNAADQFINFCAGRAWVFTDTGSTGSGEQLFEFTHRIFLEYFTAVFLCRNFSSPQQLLGVLIGKIADAEWDMVSQLALQIMSKQQEDAGDKLIEALILECHSRRKGQKDNILSFTIRALHYIVLSPKARRSIAVLTMENFLSHAAQAWARRRPPAINYPPAAGRFESVPPMHLELLLATEGENAETVRAVVHDAILAKLAHGTLIDVATCADLMHVLPFIGPELQMGAWPESRAVWANTRNTAISQSREKLEKAAEQYFPIAFIGLLDGFFTLSALVECFGFDSLSAPVNYVSTPRLVTISLLGIVSNRFFLTPSIPRSPELERMATAIEELGRIFMQRPGPWFSRKPRDKFGFTTKPAMSLPIDKNVSHSQLSPDTIFALFVLQAARLELPGKPKEYEAILSNGDWLTARFRKSYSARRNSDVGNVAEELSAAGLSVPQQKVAESWVCRKTNFVKADN
jgi:hypothetical protein